MFLAVWGESAAQEWVTEHNAQIGQAAPAPAPAAAPAAPNPEAAGPQVTITDPTTNQNVSTSKDFTIRGTATDPAAGPKAIDRVEVWLNGPREGRGGRQVGVATLDSGGGWSLTFSPTKFTASNSNMYVYSHSSFTDKTTLTTVNFNITDRS
jgi:Bacterial Ig domain